MLATLGELLRFLISTRKIWQIPIIFMLVVFFGLFAVVQGSVLAPFIYTLF